MNDVIGCLIDLDKGEIRYWKNGADLGTAFTLNQQQKSQTFFPAVVVKNAEMSFNFGAQPFKYPPPQGYTAIASAPKDRIKQNPINHSSSQSVANEKPANNAPQAIVIEPSRELAEQTYNQIQKVNFYF